MTEIHKMEIVYFQSIMTPLADIKEEVQKSLSRDQLFLYQYTNSIAAGIVHKQLAAQVAGPLNHSQWLTQAICDQQITLEHIIQQRVS